MRSNPIVESVEIQGKQIINSNLPIPAETGKIWFGGLDGLSLWSTSFSENQMYVYRMEGVGRS